MTESLQKKPSLPRREDQLATYSAEPTTQKALSRAIRYLSKPSGQYLIFVSALCLAMLGTLTDMGRVWLSSSAYLHGAFAAPTAYFLLKANRSSTSSSPPHFVSPPISWSEYVISILGLSIILSIWLVAIAAGIAIVQQFAFVFALIVGFSIFFGCSHLKNCAVPLGFLLFMPPLGDGLLWPMQVAAARFAEVLLSLTGFSPLRSGILLNVSDYSFAITEACSGLRILTAMMMTGFFIAYTAVRQMRSRMIIIVSAIILGLLANWLRVYGLIAFTVLTKDHYGLAEDHFLVGVFGFLIAIGALVWIARRFALAERLSSNFDKQQDTKIAETSKQTTPWAVKRRYMFIAPLIVATFGLYAALVTTPPVPSGPVTSLVFETPQRWKPLPTELTGNALFAHADSESIYDFTDGKRWVRMTAGVFLTDRKGAELVSYSTHTALAQQLGLKTGKMKRVQQTDSTAAIGDIWTATTSDHRSKAAATLYINGDKVFTDQRHYLIDLAASRLIGQHKPAAIVLIEAGANEGPAALSAIKDFLDLDFRLLKDTTVG